jgi:hypothetical protein
MSRLLVTYEWEWAQLDEHGDIDDLQHADPGELTVLEGWTLYSLVKSYGNEEVGIKDRAWAYVEGGVLSPVFTDGTKVPDKLLREFRSTHAEEAA